MQWETSAAVLTTTLDQAFSINSLTFAPGSGTISSMGVNTAGNTLIIGSGGLALASTSAASGTINGSGGVIVNGSQNWVNNSSQTLSVTAPITALSGSTTLTLTGPARARSPWAVRPATD